MTGVYKIESKIKPTRFYIGSAINILKRKREHLHQLKEKKHHNPKLQAHYNKYGKEDLLFSIILGCDIIDLIKIEQYFLDFYKPWFNICQTAGSILGTKRSPETLKKMYKYPKNHIPWNKGIKTGVKISTSFKKGSVPWNKGLKGFLKGRPISEEQKKKISEANKGNKYGVNAKHIVTDEIKRKISAANKDKQSPWKGKHLSEEMKAKISKAHKGKKVSEETKKKLSIATKRYWEEVKLKKAS